MTRTLVHTIRAVKRSSSMRNISLHCLPKLDGPRWSHRAPLQILIFALVGPSCLTIRELSVPDPNLRGNPRGSQHKSKLPLIPSHGSPMQLEHSVGMRTCKRTRLPKANDRWKAAKSHGLVDRRWSMPFHATAYGQGEEILPLHW